MGAPRGGLTGLIGTNPVIATLAMGRFEFESEKVPLMLVIV